MEGGRGEEAKSNVIWNCYFLLDNFLKIFDNNNFKKQANMKLIIIT